ncbi:tetratricopeptide repeat protein [Fodinibius salsisoli]|uniref:Tetratricopeptide repeat protein n=1 Tax=Fodinibius salsisoli TaxID=2820877 RepID=A0ABT3PME8_9BACT|nr:tetratricopeptide repeat protein [Fodinibius salsisoli]MCW9707035.1 tetratricopeptide repeat protein [Fodinibius salsisoli]
MKYLSFALFICIFITIGCSSEEPSTPNSQHVKYQAITALGDTLYAPPLTPETKSRFESNLKTARSNYETNSDNIENIIWYGRRTAYLGNYQQAIQIFSGGIETHPKDARLYRHRGHRYITIRQFDQAIEDLKRAGELVYGEEDQVEPDGIPNDQDNPRSTLHTNIWYHLGLAYYLKSDYTKAKNAFEECLRLSPNDDMDVAASYWLYMTLRRAGLDDLAGDILEPISEEMDIIENENYHRLLLVFKGVFSPNMLLEELQNGTSLEKVTLQYGLGNWHYINGRKERAKELFREVYESDQWNAFGYIAAEMDLKRLGYEF